MTDTWVTEGPFAVKVSEYTNGSRSVTVAVQDYCVASVSLRFTEFEAQRLVMAINKAIELAYAKTRDGVDPPEFPEPKP